jgi:hypothetical protein
VLNSYLCFLAIMLALYVVSNNGFGAEGRHWYPYAFVAFLCFVWYAPRALTRNHRTVSAVAAGVLLAYSLAAAAYAFGDLRARYYGPQRDRYVAVDPVPAQIAPRRFGMLWPVASAAYHASTGAVDFAFPSGTQLVVVGAAISPQHTNSPPAVAVELDGRVALPVLANQYAYMIAEAMRNVNEGYRAFDARISTQHLSEGAHTLAAYALLAKTQRFAVIPPTRIFFITGRNGRFSPAFGRTIARSAVVSGTLQRAGECRSDVMLMRGTVEAHPGSYFAVWMLIGDRPFPARYDPSRGTFTATIPTQALESGLQRVAAYAVAGSGESQRIVKSATLDVTTSHGAPTFPSNSPPACSDPLAQLAS